jgi:hypothetical protein
MYILVRLRAFAASRFHPRFSLSLFPSFFPSRPYYVCVPTMMINHIVLYTQCKLAIISTGGGVRQNGRMDRQTNRKRESGNGKRLSFYFEEMNEQLLHLPFTFFCSPNVDKSISFFSNLRNEIVAKKNETERKRDQRHRLRS